MEISIETPLELGFLTWKVRRTSPSPISKSNMVALCINCVKVVVISCSLAVLSYLCPIKSVVHTGSTVQHLSVDMLVRCLYVKNTVKCVFINLYWLSVAYLDKTGFVTGMIQTRCDVNPCSKCLISEVNGKQHY